MSKCEFCEAYHETVWVHDRFKADGLKYETTVAIVTRTWRDGHKRNAGRSTDYRSRGTGYKLVYCPECGTKLDEERKEE